MSPQPPSSMHGDFELTPIEEAAAGWMIERDRGLTPAQEQEFARWLRADPRHAAAFDALAETWHLIGRMQPVEDTGFDRPAPRRGKMILLPLGLAAAAAVAVAYLGWRQPSPATAAGDAMRFAMTASTEVGVLRKVELPDGSVVQLNTESVVDVRLAPTERRVRLVRGEAHFTVAPNSERPFIVTAAGVDVRVVGTVFNVRLRSEAVDVLVTEGRVVVGTPEDGERRAEDRGQRTVHGERRSEEGGRTPYSELTAGQKVSIALVAPTASMAPSPVDVSTLEIKQALAWQARRLDFDATPLGDIVGEINRYNRHKLVIADPRLHGQRFGGSFPAGDYETFVRMLEANFGVVAERKGDKTLLRMK